MAQRTPGDCLRAAVAVAYDLPYAETPVSRGQQPMNAPLVGGSWLDWAVARGLRWAWSWDLAPAFLVRWIAVVDGLGEGGRRGGGVIHAVAMEHGRLLYEPTEGRGPTYRAILPTDVRRAMWLLPADAPDNVAGTWWRIPHPEDTPHREPGVLRHAPEQDEPPPAQPDVGRNDPCWCGSGTKSKKCCGA